MKTFTITDGRINRNNNFGGYMELSSELVKSATGFDKDFSGGEMGYDFFKSTAYKMTHFDDVQIDITLDFCTHTATITYDDPIQRPEWMKELEALRAEA